MPDASPAKWHLAHTSWFFEAFVLAKLSTYRVFHSDFGFLFNSYYEGEGPRHLRAERGLLTRPSLKEVLRYRAYVDEAVLVLLGRAELTVEQRELVTLGLHHEQQHQELLITDLLHAMSRNALGGALKSGSVASAGQSVELQSAELQSAELASGLTPPAFDGFRAKLHDVGACSDGFSYDNELPRHRVYVPEFEIARSVVTNGQYLEFIRDGGYEQPLLWLSDGWHWLRKGSQKRPLYWRQKAGWEQFTVRGWVPLVLDAPVCHLNYYEATAYAAWAECRLPTEFEWEVAARRAEGAPGSVGRCLESGHWSPGAEASAWLGNVWEWTSSAYSAYPGFRTAAGSVGEYNGKFMCGQQVLRGGSCVTPRNHIRLSYRNFFPPTAQWQFSGLRLAR